MAARLLRVTAQKLEQLEPTALTQFGHLLESFVVGELLKQVSWLEGVYATGHWRTSDGDEVDLVVERYDGGVIAFEIKAGGLVRLADLRHLRKLRTALGDQFVGGFVLTTGEHAYTAEDRLHVVPIERLWTPVLSSSMSNTTPL